MPIVRFVPGVILLLMLATIAGCRSRGEAELATTNGDSSAVSRQIMRSEPEPVPSRSLIEKGRNLARRVQEASTPLQEAEALRALQEWQIENQLTFQISAISQADRRAVDDPSLATVPLEVEVTSYRQKLPIHTFSFIPQSNTNLALLGE